MLRIRTERLLGRLLLAAVWLVASAADAVTFSDGTFANGDWTATVTTQTGGASQTVLGQVASGGSPGAWREATHSFVGAGVVRVYHERQGLSFDPSTLASGEALLLDYSEDRIEISPPFGGAAVGAAPALKQDGIVYAGPGINYSNTSWATATLSGLSAADFTPYGGSGHPDFTASGNPITFGYYRTNSNTGGSSFTITHGIDDWSFTTSVAPPGTALAETKISDTAGGFTGTLVNDELFGEAVAGIGDIDGDGVGDLAVYDRGDPPGFEVGALWVLRLDADGTVAHETRVGSGMGGFVGALGAGHRFGVGLEGLGDLNYDGVPDLAAGAPGSDLFGRGAVWILFLNADGTVRSERRLGNGTGGLPPSLLVDGAAFGRAVARLGDLDGDGVTEIAVGASTAQAVYVLFLEPDGYVKSYSEISQTTLPALGLVAGEAFGQSAACPGDVDGDGVPDLAVGAYLSDEGPTTDVGAVYVFLLNADGTPKSFQKLTSASVTGGLSGGDRFGFALEELGDLDADGVPDLAVGAVWDDTAGTNAGSLHVLLLNADGSAKSSMEITEGVGGFGGNLDGSDEFGSSLGRLQGGPTDSIRLAVGAQSDDDGGSNHGAVWLVDLAGLSDTPSCGNGWLESGESCDDGNTVSGDTCSATCAVEEVLFLRGTASGGNAQATVSGELVSVATGGGQPAEQVLLALAAAIEANPTLQGLGVEATSVGQVLYTTGAISASSTSDPGLTLGERNDLSLEGSRLELGFPLVGAGPGPTVVDQNVSTLELTLAETGGFTLPASVFTTLSGFGHDAIACAPGSGTLLTNNPGAAWPFNYNGQALSIQGPAGVRCAGGLVGQRVVSTGSSLSIAYGLSPVGAGGVASSSVPPSWRVGGLPWTEGTAVVFDLGSTIGGTSQPTTLRGVDARRADGVGVFNPVTPIAFNSGSAVCPSFCTKAGDDAAFAQLRLRFVPEPMVVIGLAVGALLLAGLGRNRRG